MLPPESIAATLLAELQLAATPNIRPAVLDSLYADDVRLTLKTQPALPVRLAQH